MMRIGVAAVAVAALGGGAALAGRAMPGAFMHKRMEARVEAALDAVKATPEQRQALRGARDQVFTAFREGHQARRASLERVLTIFEADKIDEAALGALRAEREAEMKKTGDAIVAAIGEAHRVLSPTQRRELVEWVKAQRSQHEAGEPKGERAEHQHRFLEHILGRVDEALDAAQASKLQRDAIHAAVEQAATTATETFADHRAQMDRALALFERDKVDESDLAALRAEHQAKARQVGDAMAQALRDAHDALTAPQRKIVAEWVRTHVPAHGEHGFGHGG
jgi:Spy/CpxP family protein refolding chaperone